MVTVDRTASLLLSGQAFRQRQVLILAELSVRPIFQEFADHLTNLALVRDSKDTDSAFSDDPADDSDITAVVGARRVSER